MYVCVDVPRKALVNRADRRVPSERDRALFCMYVCMYVCVRDDDNDSYNLCTYVCIYVCLQVCMYVCMQVCMYIGIVKIFNFVQQ